MHLVADVLDEQIVDVDDENAGRADGIVLLVRENRPPLVAYIEIGPITLLARFSTRLARWYARYDRGLGPDRGKPFRIPWTRITRERLTLKMDCRVDATPINAVENWLRPFVKRIPGS
jgi:hypothetical protein